MEDLKIQLMGREDDIAPCYPVMRQLRPHLTERDFVEGVARQMEEGYQVLAGFVDGTPVAVAGFRTVENLAWGRFVYVDDLVTDDQVRSAGYGGELLDWLLEHCRINNLGELHLDSGVQRHGAHRFYLRRRMEITCHHFAIKVV